MNRTVGFAYDLAGRITTQTLPDLRQIGYAYDANGNVTSITPPGRPQHTFAYTPVDLESNYDPPDAGFSPKNTQYTYNLDRQLTLVTRPDGQTIQLGYEPTGGRLSTLTLPGSQTITYGYSGTTGNLASITAPGSTLAYTYDGSLLKQTTWSGTVAGSVSRNYDNNFRITSQSVNGGNTVSRPPVRERIFVRPPGPFLFQRADFLSLIRMNLRSTHDSFCGRTPSFPLSTAYLPTERTPRRTARV